MDSNSNREQRLKDLTEAILRVTDEWGFNEDYMPGYLYVRVWNLLDELDPILTDEEKKILKVYGVHQGIARISGRPDPRGIPDTCYAVIDGDVVIIQKDLKEYVSIGIELEPEEAQQFVETENEQAGVSKAQVSAMLSGYSKGWEDDLARADAYDENGLLICHEKKKAAWTFVPGSSDDSQLAINL